MCSDLRHRERRRSIAGALAVLPIATATAFLAGCGAGEFDDSFGYDQIQIAPASPWVSEPEAPARMLLLLSNVDDAVFARSLAGPGVIVVAVEEPGDLAAVAAFARGALAAASGQGATTLVTYSPE